jgi:hypothetical protein
MHDEMLERRLHDALRAEGDSLGLTITAAELERRLAARRRERATRGFGLLLAAALSLVALGTAAVAGGFLAQHESTPAPSHQAQLPPPAPIASANPVAPGEQPMLPSLDVLIGRVGVSGLIVAQEHGPAIAGTIDTAGASRSLLDLGPIAGHGSYEAMFGCVSNGGPSDAAGISVVLAGSAVGAPEGMIPCDGSVTTQPLGDVTGPFLVRVATPPQSSWRIVVRLADGQDIPPRAGLSDPVAVPGQMAVVDASGDHRKPSPMIGDTTTSLGTLPRRPVYHAQASCLGAPSMAWLIGAQDSRITVFVDTTTIVPCDGRVHAADLSFGEMNWQDVFVLANPATDWHLLVTVQPPPISTAPEEPGWTLSTDAGPIYTFADTAWGLVGDAHRESTRIRVIVTCLGGTSVDVAVTSNLVQGSPPFRSYSVPCQADAPTTSTEVITAPDGSWDVETTMHGRMWFAATVQQEVGASQAP